jgi:hypothetical protein
MTAAAGGTLVLKSREKAGSRKAAATEEKGVPGSRLKLTVPPAAERGEGLEATERTDVPLAETCEVAAWRDRQQPSGGSGRWQRAAAAAARTGS